MKKLLASLMALSMVFAVTGCSESSDSSSESKAEAKTTTTTTAAPAAESKADTTTTTAAPEESVADTTTSANDTTSTGDEAKGTYKDNVYTSDLYTFKIDSKKWAMQESAGVDVMFTYADAGDDAELESASINVISMSNDRSMVLQQVIMLTRSSKHIIPWTATLLQTTRKISLQARTLTLLT